MFCDDLRREYRKRDKYLGKLCVEKNMNYCGCIGITMPENYIALFSTPTEEKALQIIERAEGVIDRVALFIKRGERFPKSDISFGDKINSGIVNDIFYPIFVHAKKFYVTGDCVSCGKCVGVCPLNNVRLENGKPVWGDSCTHCMACICHCPMVIPEHKKLAVALLKLLRKRLGLLRFSTLCTAALSHN